MKTIIKFFLILLVILALIGGAVEFESTDDNWRFLIEKEAVLNSVQNGVMKIYDFIVELFND